MKLINFSANIAKNSNKLICQSDKNFLTIDEGFSIRIEDDHYVIRDVEKEEVEAEKRKKEFQKKLSNIDTSGYGGRGV